MGATSLPWVAFDTTRETLKRMAREKVFSAIGDVDRIRPVHEKSIVGRLGRNDPAFESIERGIDLPGFSVTYMGMKGGVSQGSLQQDDRIIQILVQLIDSTDEGDATRAETYFRWMSDIREWLQANPYNDADYKLGQIFLVHVTDESLPDEQKWAIDREMRMYAMVNCWARLRRTKDQPQWR